MQLQAGYFIEAIKTGLLQASRHPCRVERMIHKLCHFDLETDIGSAADTQNPDPLIAVAGNFISRGLPARPSTYIEDVFSKTFQRTIKHINKLGGIRYALNGAPLDFNRLYNALHIIEPRLQHENNSKRPSNRYETDFLYKHIPACIGDYFVQLLEPQRNLADILGHDAGFSRQQVDFAIEFPYPIAGKKGGIIEIDGGQHEFDPQQYHLDRERDKAAEKAGWATIRIKTKDFNSLGNPLNRIKKWLKTIVLRGWRRIITCRYI